MFQYLEEYHNDHLKCTFCRNYVIYPRFCQECSNFYCQKCPGNEENNICCNQIVTNLPKPPLNGKGSIAEILGKMRVRCLINYANGCQWQGERHDYPTHQKECEKNYQPCIYGCGKIIHQEDLRHLDQCEGYPRMREEEDPAKLATSHLYLQSKIASLEEENHRLQANMVEMNNLLKESIHRLTLQDKMIASLSEEYQRSLKKTIYAKLETFNYLDYYEKNKERLDFEIKQVDNLQDNSSFHHVIDLFQVTLPDITADWDVTLHHQGLIYGQNYTNPCGSFYTGFRHGRLYFGKVNGSGNNCLQRESGCQVVSENGYLSPDYHTDPERKKVMGMHLSNHIRNDNMLEFIGANLTSRKILSVKEGYELDSRTITAICFLHSFRDRNTMRQVQILAEKRRLGLLTVNEQREIEDNHILHFKDFRIIAREI